MGLWEERHGRGFYSQPVGEVRLVVRSDDGAGSRRQVAGSGRWFASTLAHLLAVAEAQFTFREAGLDLSISEFVSTKV